ncbi:MULTISPECIES: DUF1972 domain-containing protein [Sphingomonas]|jgi:glycosyltransferase involved in cell wall biosynthesis|uniref:DUF1972 domain-containing protein n=1 Tax=Sphingomonas TaxID=13687 RepID=UPI00082A3710|nr:MULTISPECIES: DUF1972 domain-containing protein [Sphingomonas]MBY0301337.1 DUF1972 domain-containing protein [Sphingomonas ginsenosidimutans]
MATSSSPGVGDTRHLVILGIRGVPAAHGGFETFAARLAPWMRDHGWRVTVYCQGSETRAIHEDEWEGVRRIHIPVGRDGAAGTIEFDVKSARHALAEPGLILMLGYNTGFLATWLRIKGRRQVINMDGVEWKRAKYSAGAKAYLWVNERLAAAAGDVLIADHPSIGDHLAQRAPKEKIVMLPYGSDRIDAAGTAPLDALGLEPGRFLTLIARPEPENSILEIVEAFSAAPRDVTLAVLGNYSPDNPFHARVRAAAGPQVKFVGAIYDPAALASLRFHSLAYMHGHRVGGTNPSLVEALGAGNPVIAHDNRFNRWVAGDAATYFADTAECRQRIDEVLADDARRAAMAAAARRRWEEAFTWPMVLSDYQALLERVADGEPR